MPGAAGRDVLHVRAERVEIPGGALRGYLLVALVVDVVVKRERAGALGDARRLVVGGVGDGAAQVRARRDRYPKRGKRI